MTDWLFLLTAATAGFLIGHFLYPFLFKKPTKPSPPVSAPDSHEMLLFVRRDLKMRIGKIAAQIGHGSISIFLKLVKTHPAVAEAWATERSVKKFFYCPDEETLLTLEKQAKEQGYRATIIHDAGRTQIAAGSATVLAVAPVPSERVKEFVPESVRPIP
jgi:PTH2 family peptidyl-tRNA hydrolase